MTRPTTSGGTVTWTAAYETVFSQLTTVTDPLSRQTVYTVNATTGDTTAIRDARSNTTAFTFAANGDRLTATSALNKITQFTYDPEFGDLATVTDPLNHVTTFRVTKRSLPWDITDANGKKILDQTYDDLEQLIEEDQTLNGNTLRTQYFYDGNGHRITVQNPNTVSWSTTYNTLDQVDNERDPANRFTTYLYDLNGNVSRRTDRKGQYLLYTYGPADRLEGIACYKIGSILESTVVLNYDPTTKLLTSVTDNEFGLQTWSWTYDSLDRITGASGPNGSVTYTLDTLGRRTGMTATGQSPITYGFTPIDQIASIVQGGQTSSFTYDPLNRMSRRSLPNNTTTDWTFDDAGFLTSLISKKSGVTFDSHLYTPDPAGHIVQENKNGTLDTFGYDELYRLTSATVSGASYRWSYDNNGNRLTQDKGLAHTDYTCDQCDCLLSVNGLAVTSDANGSATGFGSDVYSWDVRNRLVKLTRPGLTIDFTYDPFGNRTSKKVNGTLTKFLLDGDSVVSEVTGATTVSTLQSPVLDQPLSRNGRFFAPNELGSTTKLTDALGGVVQSYDYSPFGETSQSTGEANPFQYAGRENDGTGLYYNRARYYVPEWGRFMSEDPLGFAGGLNRYTYAGNDPINWVDYAGTARELPSWAPYLISGLTSLGGMLGIMTGSGIGGGLGMGGGPAAPATVPLGAVVGGAVGGVKGAATGAALGVTIVLIYDAASDLFQRASGSGGSGSGSSPTPVHDTVQSSQGPLEFDAQVHVEGDRLFIEDIMLYPVGKPRLQLGLKETLSVLRPLVRKLAEQYGVTKVHLDFSRTGGATPGRSSGLDWTIR